MYCGLLPLPPSLEAIVFTPREIMEIKDGSKTINNADVGMLINDKYIALNGLNSPHQVSFN